MQLITTYRSIAGRYCELIDVSHRDDGFGVELWKQLSTETYLVRCFDTATDVFTTIRTFPEGIENCARRAAACFDANA